MYIVHRSRGAHLPSSVLLDTSVGEENRNRRIHTCTCVFTNVQMLTFECTWKNRYVRTLLMNAAHMRDAYAHTHSCTRTQKMQLNTATIICAALADTSHTCADRVHTCVCKRMYVSSIPASTTLIQGFQILLRIICIGIASNRPIPKRLRHCRSGRCPVRHRLGHK